MPLALALTLVWIRSGSLFLLCAALAVGGFWMGHAYKRQWQKLIRTPRSGREPNYDRSLLHAKKLSTASNIASAGVFFFGTMFAVSDGLIMALIVNAIVSK